VTEIFSLCQYYSFDIFPSTVYNLKSNFIGFDDEPNQFHVFKSRKRL